MAFQITNKEWNNLSNKQRLALAMIFSDYEMACYSRSGLNISNGILSGFKYHNSYSSKNYYMYALSNPVPFGYNSRVIQIHFKDFEDRIIPDSPADSDSTNFTIDIFMRYITFPDNSVGVIQISRYLMVALLEAYTGNYIARNKVDLAHNFAVLFHNRYYITPNVATSKVIYSTKDRVSIIADKLVFQKLCQQYNNISFRNCLFPDKDEIVFINPNIQKMCGIGNLISIKTLCGICNVDYSQLKEDIKTFAKSKTNLMSIGLGGASSAILHYIDRIADEFHVDKPINELIVYEDDILDITNLPRIMLDYMESREKEGCGDDSLSNVSKLKLLDGYKAARAIVPQPMKFKPGRVPSNYIMFGALDVETRVKMVGNYYATFHNDYSAYLYYTPKYDEQDGLLVQETYGKVDITNFFLNMFKLTTEFISDIVHKYYYRNGEEELIGEYNVTLPTFNSKVSKSSKSIVIL